MQRHMHYIIWGVQGLGVLLTGLFVATGLNALGASWLSSQAIPDVKPKKDPPALAAADDTPPEGALENLRNIFNHHTPSALRDDTPPEDASASARDTLAPEDGEKPDVVDEPPPAPLTGPQPTDLPLTLIGTQVASDPRWSIAIVKANDGGEKTFYARVGQTLLDDAAIIQIVRDRVYFRRLSKQSQLEYVSIDADPAEALARATRAAMKPPIDKPAEAPTFAPSRPDPSASAPQAAAPPPPSTDALDPSRIKVVDGNVVVPRDMAEAIRNNQNLLKDPRFGPPPQLSPYYRNKKVEGFKIMGLQQGSLFNNIGLQNGDTIMNINGELVDKPQKAMAMFDSLRPGEDVKVKVNRKGQIKTLTFKLD
jgi:type II secretion system protein C